MKFDKRYILPNQIVKGISRKKSRIVSTLIEHAISIILLLFGSQKLARSLINRLEPKDYMNQWFFQPLNGQFVRLKHVINLCDDFKPTVCIETGTYRGTTTIFLATLSSKITYTIEINKKFFLQAKARLQNFDQNIQLINGDSAQEMKILLNNHSPIDERLLVYLDAHWGEVLPIRDEVKVLCNWGGKFIAIIDDFCIPTDSGFSFDVYSGIPIGLDLIPLYNGLEVWVSTIESGLETGAKRGTAYVFSSGISNEFSTLAMANLKQIR
jgi:hypothetical protein